MPADSPNAALTGAPAALLEQWFEHAPIGLALVDRRGQLTHANAAVRAVAGRDAAALLAEPAVAAALRAVRAGARPDPVALHCPGDPARAPGVPTDARAREGAVLKPASEGGPPWGILVSLLELPDAVAMTVQRIPDDRLTGETLRLALEGTGTGSWVWDVETDAISWSANLGPLHGLPRGDGPRTHAAFLESVHPDDRERVAGQVRAALQGADDYDVDYRSADGAQARWLHTRAHVVRDVTDGPARAVVGLTTDITARHRREAAAEVLADAGLALAVMRTPEDTLQRIADLVVPRLADWCVAHLLDEDDRPTRIAVAHVDPDRVAWATSLSQRAAGPSRGVAEVLRTGRAVLYREIDDARLAETAGGDETRLDLLRALDPRSAMMVPICAHDRTLGALTFAAAESDRRYDEADLALAEELGRRAGLAVENATLQRAQEEANRRLRDVQAVTDIALTHLELQAMLDELMHRLAALLDSDVAKVLLFDDRRQSLRVRAATGLDRDVATALEVPAGQGVAGRLAVAGRPLILSDLGHEDVVLDDLREPGRALAGVPLRVAGETIGVLIVSSRERPYNQADLHLLELVADRAGLAIRQAELYDAARAAALSLQRSLLPDVPPLTAGLQIAARYLPGQDGDEVGGDWYDVFALPDGRVAIAVGDIVGRGLHAAARMGRVSTALRAYAYDSASPADAVLRLDRLVTAEDIVAFATLLLIFLDPQTGAGRACSAGHPPPLLLGADGAGVVAIAVGPPLGVGSVSRRESALTVPDGATLLAYTDGLVERRSVALDAGIERVRAAAATGPPEESAEQVVERIVATVIGSSATDDDIALVAVRRLGRGLQRTFPAEPPAVAAARHELTSFAHAHGFAEELVGDLALAVSEACTNVVVHAYRDHPGPGPMHISARLDGGTIEVTVADEGGGVRPRGDSPGVGLGLQIMSRTAESCEVRDAPGGGARLVLRFVGRADRVAETRPR
ncbi:MAG: SpoIIE family protein phosphatase [Solirubrobacterales bacterium]